MKKFLKRFVVGLVLTIVVLVIYIFAAWDKTFDAPLPDIHASKDSAIIARGKYLAFGPAHCATCHVPMDKINAIDKGEDMPLSGGWELNIAPGSFRAPNLTPDMETGIGKLSDGQIARALRYMVNDKNKMMFPFMPFQDLSDADLTAIVSFLRSQKAVKNVIKPKEFTFLGKALLAFGVLKPQGPSNATPPKVFIDSTVEYGSYITHSVANCVGCHTERNMKTGEFTGVPFAGGLALPPDSFSEGYSYVTPNLTTDEETGVMAQWNEKSFINRFRAGRMHRTSPMPWGVFSRMNEVELKAIYRYLHTLQPVKRKVEKTVYAPGEAVPAHP
jgi:mono/diheme cytochrome c family protein